MYKRIVKARLDELDCVVLKICLSSQKLDLLRAAHYSEVYVKGGGIPLSEWVGRSVVERKPLALFVGTRRWGGGIENVTAFFAKMPESRTDCRHPEWGEPRGPHYVIPLSFPVSKIVLFEKELGREDEEE